MSYWFLWMLAGIVSLIGGVVALANPLAATLTAEQLAGWMFLAVGVLTLLSAFRDQGWGGRLLTIFLGLAILLFGIGLVANPVAGVLSLTYMAALIMLVLGILRLALAFSTHISPLRWMLGLSGLVSLALGIMIFANWPQSATVVLGLFLAIELISNGISLIFLSLMRKALGNVL
ncbi:MAG: hypothetical protein CSA68_00535 [Rhodobacterales bacterium]|nr:MAG: hypothetical protein CSA68_00535 [Rhodobacterales bacterium]